MTNLGLLSLFFERLTGADSLRTMRNMYGRGAGGRGAYQCPFPSCTYSRYDIEELWHHAHFSRKHDTDGEWARLWMLFELWLDDTEATAWEFFLENRPEYVVMELPDHDA